MKKFQPSVNVQFWPWWKEIETATQTATTKQCCALKKTNKKTTKLPTWFFSTMLQRLPVVLKMWWEEGGILDHWKLPFLTTLVNSLVHFRIRSENLPKLGLLGRFNHRICNYLVGHFSGQTSSKLGLSRVVWKMFEVWLWLKNLGNHFQFI